jgi:hypothetical protein
MVAKKRFRPVKRRAIDGSGNVIGLEEQLTQGGWPYWSPVQKAEHGTQIELEFQNIDKAHEYLAKKYGNDFLFDRRLA